MPTYNFKHKETDEVIEKIFSISNLDSFLKENPVWEQVILYAPNAVDPTKLSATKKYDGGFKEVLSKIHERNPGSVLNTTSSQL